MLLSIIIMHDYWFAIASLITEITYCYADTLDCSSFCDVWLWEWEREPTSYNLMVIISYLLATETAWYIFLIWNPEILEPIVFVILADFKKKFTLISVWECTVWMLHINLWYECVAWLHHIDASHKCVYLESCISY